MYGCFPYSSPSIRLVEYIPKSQFTLSIELLANRLFSYTSYAYYMLNYPLTEPAVIPVTKNRCKKINNITIGTAVMTTPVNSNV